MTKLIIKSEAPGPKRQFELSPFHQILTQCSTGHIFISADIISIEEKKKKRDEICNLIKFLKQFHIFITFFFFLELWLSDHNHCNYEQPAGVLAFSALWGTSLAALHSQCLATSQQDTCQQERKVQVDFCNYKFRKGIYLTVLKLEELVCRLLLLLQKGDRQFFLIPNLF